MSVRDITQLLREEADPDKAKFLARYFKTGKGEYGEEDVFIGVTVPQVRKIAKKYKDLSLSDIQKLLKSKFHEYRLTALIILTYKENTKDIVRIYLRNTKYINNWDLVDLSARDIIGGYLIDKPRDILYRLVKSKSLWERRIAVLATFAFLKKKNFKDSFAIAEILLHDPHDLMHKAVGWMLREIGKIDQEAEENFLKKRYKTMPRTMLRYAIERFTPDKRALYMAR